MILTGGVIVLLMSAGSGLAAAAAVWGAEASYDNTVSTGALLILGALAAVITAVAGIYFGLTRTLRDVIEARGIKIEELEDHINNPDHGWIAKQSHWSEEKAELLAQIKVLQEQPNLQTHAELLGAMTANLGLLTRTQAQILERLEIDAETRIERQAALLDAIHSHVRHPGSRTRGAGEPPEGKES